MIYNNYIYLILYLFIFIYLFIIYLFIVPYRVLRANVLTLAMPSILLELIDLYVL